jgi:hypothetical protein
MDRLRVSSSSLVVLDNTIGLVKFSFWLIFTASFPAQIVNFLQCLGRAFLVKTNSKKTTSNDVLIPNFHRDLSRFSALIFVAVLTMANILPCSE